MQGSRTPEETELEFRKHYLVTGNVAGSAKAVGLPPSTGYELRNRALKDPEFVEARRLLRESVGPDAEQMAVAAMQICMERLSVDPDKRLERMMTAGAEKVHFQDPGPQYAAGIAKLMQAINQGRKLETDAQTPERQPVEVHVHLKEPGDGDPTG